VDLAPDRRGIPGQSRRCVSPRRTSAILSLSSRNKDPTVGFISCCFRLECQTVCKPGSVPPRVCGGDGHSSGTFVAERLARPTRAAARQARPATPLDRDTGTPPAAPTWSCSRWGLPCRRRCRRRGALLPQPFHPCRPCRPMRQSQGRPGLAVCFCGTFPGVAPAGRYPAPCLRGARTFLPPVDRKAERRAAIRPSGMGRYGMRFDCCKPGRRIASAAAPIEFRAG